MFALKLIATPYGFKVMRTKVHLPSSESIIFNLDFRVVCIIRSQRSVIKCQSRF